ncbi:ribosome biogenesis GTP-binding protein YihA/YsxC [Cyclobacteriaceae bacterium]|nr:ribosome biogenesis GTP-binding protein YihA/YsxC [Cyclobacteriaceae bacterium]
MQINTINFLKSSQDLSQCPETPLPEVAFIGRSNVGKSSLINMLTERKKLAKVSATPGKTQLINHFEINEQWNMVDLPGYGWASVSKTKKEQWEANINEYLLERENLIELFVLIDIRHEPQKIDINFIDWLYDVEIPFSIIFTKADKLSKNKVFSHASKYLKIVKKIFGDKPHSITTSAEGKQGRDDVLDYIESLLSKYESFNNE